MFDIYGRNKDYFTADYSAWRQCVHPDDIANAEKLFKESIEKFIPYLCKFRIIQPDGTIKYIQAKAKIEAQQSLVQIDLDKVQMLMEGRLDKH